MLYDAVVVGAGPAGSATARDIALEGFKVLLIEEHAAVGGPSHCPGLVARRTLNAPVCAVGSFGDSRSLAAWADRRLTPCFS